MVSLGKVRCGIPVFVRTSHTEQESRLRFLSAPAISRLTLTPARMTTCDRLLRGKYGPVLRRGRTPYVAIAAIEAFHGLKFSEAQLALAVDGKAERLLEIPDHQEET
jgi:hypothetical protein